MLCRCCLLLSCSDLSFKKDTRNCTVLGPAVPDFLAPGYFRTPYYWFHFICRAGGYDHFYFFPTNEHRNKARSNGLNPFLHNFILNCPRKLSPHMTGNCATSYVIVLAGMLVEDSALLTVEYRVQRSENPKHVIGSNVLQYACSHGCSKHVCSSKIRVSSGEHSSK